MASLWKPTRLSVCALISALAFMYAPRKLLREDRPEVQSALQQVQTLSVFSYARHTHLTVTLTGLNPNPGAVRQWGFRGGAAVGVVERSHGRCSAQQWRRLHRLRLHPRGGRAPEGRRPGALLFLSL
eukprot:27679-Rhodomonas_salina.2